MVKISRDNDGKTRVAKGDKSGLGGQYAPDPAKIVAAKNKIALIEATDDIFSDVARELEVAETELRELMNHLDALYEGLLQSKPQLSRYSAGIVGDLLPCAIEEPKAKVVALFQDKGYLIENIRERLDEEAIYSTSAVLFAYLCLVESKDLTKAHWPLSGTVLDDLGADLGISFD